MLPCSLSHLMIFFSLACSSGCTPSTPSPFPLSATRSLANSCTRLARAGGSAPSTFPHATPCCTTERAHGTRTKSVTPVYYRKPRIAQEMRFISSRPRIDTLLMATEHRESTRIEPTTNMIFTIVNIHVLSYQPLP